MTRDYAKGPEKRRFPIIAVLTGIAIGSGLALIGTVLLTPLPENEERLIQNGDVDLVVEEEKARQAAAKPSLPPEEPARFKFYELLPNLEIIPFVDPTPHPRSTERSANPARESAPAPATRPAQSERVRPTNSPSAPTSGERFWIQAGSFRNADDAEARRVHLILLGFAPKVEAATVAGKGVFHRVRIGPLASSDQARSAMRRLAEDGVESYVQRER